VRGRSRHDTAKYSSSVRVPPYAVRIGAAQLEEVSRSMSSVGGPGFDREGASG